MSDSSQSGVTMISSAARLGLFGAVFIGLLVGVHWLTKDRIAEQQRLSQLRSLQAVLPDDLYNNDPLIDYIDVSEPNALGSRDPQRIYRARLNNQPSALVIQATAPDGYNGDIGLLVGVKANGEIIGVRVTNHRETPGLGDKIDHRISNWIDSFTGRSLPPSEQWAVQKKGGEFDQFTGATITPQATIKAVQRTLEYVQSNQAELFERKSMHQAQHLAEP